MTTMDDILNLIASHKQENQAALAQLSVRMQEQEQELSKLLATYVSVEDQSASKKNFLNKAKVRDLEYWYTPLSEISGYAELGSLLQLNLRKRNVHYLGNLVVRTEEDLRRESLGRKTLDRIKTWLLGLDEKLGQELKEYRENQVLLQHFDEKIAQPKKLGLAEYRLLRWETYAKLNAMKISTIGELATSDVVSAQLTLGDKEDVDTYLKQYDENLRLGMHLPYRPS